MIDSNKDSTTTFLMRFDCLIDALWEDFDRPIAEKCFQIIAGDRWQHFNDPAIVSDYMETRLNRQYIHKFCT